MPDSRRGKPEKKLNVGILCGGKSAEHEVSLQSAKNIFEALDREKYHPILIGIDKAGRWQLHDRPLLNAGDPKRICLDPACDSVTLIPGGALTNRTQSGRLEPVDVFFPVLHGPFGEDGTVQGLLKLAGMPFVGSGVLGSAVGMDKDVMKRLFRDAGLPIGKFITMRAREQPVCFEDAVRELGLPLFVKPANMGSSVGVNKVHNEAEYFNYIEQAFQYDTKVILEEYIEGRELECSVLDGEEPSASVPGEVIAKSEFYSYEAKYIDENGATLEIPAVLSDEKKQEIQQLAIRAFQALDCAGLARADFFMRNRNGQILINELNTLPGFTRISMYPKLWEASGLSQGALLDRLIELALTRFQREQALKTSYV